MGTSRLPEGCSARPPTMDDAAAVARVLAAVESAHGHGTESTEESVRSDWSTFDLEAEAIVIESQDQQIVATADVLNHAFESVTVYGYVHPAWTGLGLGGYLVGWGEQWTRDRLHLARPEHQVDVRHFIAAQDQSALDLLQAHGYNVVRVTNVMQILLNELPQDPIWPDGIQQAPYWPGVDNLEVHESVEDSFQDIWGRPPGTFEQFQKEAQAKGSQPDLWITVRAESGEIIGTALGSAEDGHGWIGGVGVRRGYRQRGIGLALLRACFQAFYRHNIHDVRLSVDFESVTGAPRLYERAGMQAISSYYVHQKILRDGIAPGS